MRDRSVDLLGRGGGGQSSMRLSSKPNNSSVQPMQLHHGSQLVILPRRVSGGDPVEGSGDELVLEDQCEPCGEKDEGGAPDRANGCVEDEEDVRHEESKTPEEHGLGKTEKECQILEAVGAVSTFGEVGVL
jgi:hypothetical protein